MKKYLLFINILLLQLAPAPRAVAQNSQTVANGGMTTPITLSCSFSWTNDNPGIGLPASGTGNISAFTAINTGSTPVTANVRITPASYAFIPCTNPPSRDIVVINTATGIVVNRIAVIPRQATTISPDQQFLYVQGTTGIAKIRTTDGSIIGTYLPGLPIGDKFLVSADGASLYMSSTADNKVYIINTSSMTLVTTVTTDPASIQTTGMIFSPDQSKLYVANPQVGNVSVVNTATNTVTGTIPLAPGSIEIAISPDGSTLYVTNQITNRVYQVNTATNVVLSSISVPGSPSYCLLSADGSRLYVSNQVNNTVTVINTATFTIITNIPVGSNPFGLSLTPDGSQLYVSDDLSNAVSVINTSTNTVVNTIAVDNFPDPWGNFIANPCGASYTYTITVNPAATITATPMTGTIYACVNNPSAPPDIGTISVSGSNLTGNIIATAPAGFEISLSPGSGYSSSVTLVQAAGTVSNMPVYVRAAASITASNLTGAVILSTTGGTAQNVAVRGTIATCTVAPTGQTVTNGQTTTLVPSPGCGSTWINNTPGIGLPASGTGDLPSFTAINTGTTPITATITVNPTSYAYVQCSNSNLVDVINTTTGTVDNQLYVPNTSFALATSPDGQYAYCYSSSNGLTIIRTSDNTVSTIPIAGLPSATDFVLSRSGLLMYMSSLTTNQVFVFSTTPFFLVQTINLPGGPTGGKPSDMVLSPDESTLYVTDEKTGSIHVISTASFAVTATIPFGSVNDLSMGVNISPDGSKLYVTDQTANSVKVINTATNTVIATIPVPGQGPTHSILSVDGATLYTSNSVGGTVSVINTGTNTVIATIPVGADPFGLSLTPDGSQLYVINVVNNTISVISTATNTIVRTIPTDQEPQPWGNFIASPCGLPYTYTITVNPSPSITATAVSGTIQACAGTPSASPDIQTFSVSGTYLTANITATAPAGFELSLSPGSGYGSSVTLTQAAGSVTNIPVYVRSSASAPAGTPTGNVILSTTSGTNKNIPIGGTINALVTPSITIAASANTICAGTPVTFTATPANGGTVPAYQWQLNGSNTGANNPTFTSSTLNNNDQVTCVLTSNAACATAPATSNTITMTVNPLVTPSLTIAASANAICAGTPVTFTATPTGQGTAPIYQWLLNGSNTGTNNPTFTSSTLNNTDQVTCVLTSNATCATAPATSNTITMTVTPLVTPSLTIAASANTICSGVPVTFTATPTNGGTTPAYQWQLNGSNTGTNSPTFTTNTLNNTDQVTCVLTSNAACATAPATSNTIPMTVTPLVTPSITIAASANSICAGSPVTFTATPANGGTVPAYQWRLNGSNTGTNSPTFTTSTLNNTDQVSCTLTSNAACATGTAPGNTITMTVTPLVTPSLTIAASANTICAGSPVTFTTTPINQGANPAYQWQLNGSNTGINSPTFTTSTLNNTDQVSCTLTSDAACLTTATALSIPVTMNVTQKNAPSVTITPPAPEICTGTPVTFTVTASNAGPSPTYQWMVNDVAQGGNAATYSSTLLHDGDQVVCTVTGNLTCAVPGISLPATIKVDPLPTINFPVDPVYKGSGGVQLEPSITGSIAQYEWSPAEGLSAVDIANPIADPANSQTYQLEVTTDKGCRTSGKVTVIPHLPLVMSNAFTPNGDGHNDVFRIPVGATLTLDQFSVFNRWGAEVFSTRNIAAGWDGTYRGQPAPSGTYVYMITGKDSGGKPIAIRGTVILIR